MAVHIIIGGDKRSALFAQICLLADYLSQHLPDFCYERIEKSILEWQKWLTKINEKNNWHHIGSPIVWKETLIKGSKPIYVGGAPEFLEYCHSYYNFDFFLAPEKFKGLVENYVQYKNKLQLEILSKETLPSNSIKSDEESTKRKFSVSISGASNPIAMHLISGLLELSVGDICISKIYIYDDECSENFLRFVQSECGYIGSSFPGKVVKYVEKIGSALTSTDLFIILDHVPFCPELSIGDWLFKNKKLMKNIALMINVSASIKMRILFPNLGPACYNATILRECVNEVYKDKIAVATSDLGLEIISIAAEIAGVPSWNIFCPPVWGFVGINHLVDIRTTIHKYNYFEPYKRYTKVKNSTLTIGSLTPEMRSLEYLMYFDDSLWKKVAEQKEKTIKNLVPINKVIPLLDVVRLWLFKSSPNDVVNLGIKCDGSFNLTFDGIFSQPSRLVNDVWVPANNFLMPRDFQIKLPYLDNMAKVIMKIKKGDLPKIVPYFPCTCKKKIYKKKDVWLNN